VELCYCSVAVVVVAGVAAIGAVVAVDFLSQESSLQKWGGKNFLSVRLIRA